MAPKFEIHLENWNHALHVENLGHKSDVFDILDLCRKYKVHPIVYVLKDWETDFEVDKMFLDFRELTLKSHGVHHYYDEKADRSPYFNQEGLPFPPSGGFFFRIMPLCYLKWAIKKSDIFWIHPHDLDENHPRLKNPLFDFKRRVGIKNAKKKLERLLKEVRFE